MVAVNEHSSDPHFNPTMESSHIIKHGDWLLIDVWGRIDKVDSMFADITWTAFVGDQVPEYHQMVFDSVICARDRAVTELKQSIGDGKPLCGWEVDKIAREIQKKHYIKIKYYVGPMIELPREALRTKDIAK